MYRLANNKNGVLVIGYNKSDLTYGWDGKVGGFTLYFSHFTDMLIEPYNSIPLSQELSPILNLQTAEQTYMSKFLPNYSALVVAK